MKQRYLTFNHRELLIEYNSIETKQQKETSKKPDVGTKWQCNNLTGKCLIFIKLTERIIRLIIALCVLFLLLWPHDKSPVDRGCPGFHQDTANVR